MSKRKKPGSHRKRRPRRALQGMMLHIDGSEHGWFGDQRRYELICVLDDATSEIYYAQLVEAQELGVKIIPAYSPEARGRSERNFGTWQGRLPQELRTRGIQDREAANRFLREEYIVQFNQQFAVPAAQKGSAFVRCRSKDLDWIFSIQHERTVGNDNTVAVENRVFQIERTRWRNTLAGQIVVVHEHLDGNVSIRYGANLVAQFAVDELPPRAPKRRGTPRLPIGNMAA